MKKLLTLLLLTALLVSCGTPTDSINLTEHYLLHTEDGVLMKFNVYSGSDTPVCQDPICAHDSKSDCPLASVELFALEDDTIFYTRRKYDDSELLNQLCTYDIRTQKSRVAVEAKKPDSSGFAFFNGGKYYEQCFTSENEMYYLVADMSNGETEMLDDMPSLSGKIMDGRQFYTESDDGGISVYSSLIDGSDSVTLASGIDFPVFSNYLFTTCCYDTRDERLLRYDYASGEKTLVLENVAYTAEFDELMVCYIREDEPEIIGHCETTGKDIVDTYGGRLWIIKAETGEILAEVETDEVITTDVQRVAECFVVSYGAFIDNNGSTLWNHSGGGRLVYDMKTGEIRKFPV